MPELPEVETIVKELNQLLPGRTIAETRVFRQNALGSCSQEEFRKKLRGATFGKIERRGKFMLFSLPPAGFLIGHLRMTGKFILSPPLTEPLPHHRVWFELEEGGLLVFDDMRCFGTLAIVESLSDFAPLARLGMEPLSAGFTGEWLAGALARSNWPVKNWLMDQSKIAGLGNIYVAEILFRSALSPLRRTAEIAPDEADLLCKTTRQVLREAIRHNGTTISDYRRVDNKSGSFQNFLRVYGKAGRPCPNCRRPIRRIKQQQRSTFYCPSCQQ